MEKIKLLQWNIWYKEKIENTVKLLKKTKADIICLQELTVNEESNNRINTAEFVADKLGFNSYYKIANTFTDGGSVIDGIFSRFEIEKTEHIFVQESKNKNDYSSEGRVLVAGKIKITPEFSVKVATTHLSYTHKFQETQQKNEEVKRLLDYIKKQDKKFILTGDLNVAPDSNTIKDISKILKSCGPDLTNPTWTTKPFDYKGFQEDKLRWRLDYVFSTPDIEVCSAKILDTNYSDHLPILIEFRL